MRRKSKYFNDLPDKEDKNKAKKKINAKEVRLIDHTGENLGIVSTSEAIKKAKDVDMDLIEVSTNTNSPVCKIMDYGKYLYEQSKKQKECSKSSKHEDKEIRLRPSIDKHDLEIKAKKAKEFLAEGRKVNISIKLKGRENRHIELVDEVVQKFYEILKDYAKLEDRGGSYILIPTVAIKE